MCQPLPDHLIWHTGENVLEKVDIDNSDIFGVILTL